MKKIKILALVLGALTFVACDNGLSHEVQRQVITAEKAIENYEYFKLQERGIKAKYQDEVIATEAIERFIKMLPTDRSLWERYDKNELSRLETIRDGIRYTVNSMVAEYEAKASMKHKGLFQNNLPTNIFRGTNQILEFKYSMPNFMGGN